MDCLFCKIVNGEIPAKKIYEDETVLAFLDINPDGTGHTLVIPKKHYENISDIDDETLSTINQVTKKLFKVFKEKLHADGMSLNQNNEYGQEIKHYHIHLVPRFKGDNYHSVCNRELIKSPEEVYEILKSAI